MLFEMGFLMVEEIVGQRLRGSGVHAALVGYNCNHDLNALCTWWWIEDECVLQAGHELIFLCESDPGARQVWLYSFMMDVLIRVMIACLLLCGVGVEGAFSWCSVVS